jgi:hypothetical protein
LIAAWTRLTCQDAHLEGFADKPMISVEFKLGEIAEPLGDAGAAFVVVDFAEAKADLVIVAGAEIA